MIGKEREIGIVGMAGGCERAKCALVEATRITAALAAISAMATGYALSQEVSDCESYRGKNPITSEILVYDAPPIAGAVPETRTMTYRPEYELTFIPGASGEVGKTELFAVDIATGSPAEEPQNFRNRKSYFTLLVDGLAYSKPAYSLAALAAAPVKQPLTVSLFETTDRMLAGFEEVRVKDQADHVTEERQIAVEFAPDGEVSAVLACDKIGAFPSPTCSLHEQLGLFSSKITFLRSELFRIKAIRDKAWRFAFCLLE